ncbi:outer membrane beta-barrel protein [Parvularcula sp. ZS-1/3]|uniref:Outer membrane beta-barrel protein n=1 Tax=Parvularcula mediterranea TaxID=2732508 RepID=A0A7Y3RKP5_9PROT|nr:outer membrane beta-barrel protein [Parvularcula mediterranea]NNU15843.1 outer membrane beta-barrel protein [Parvularcula mediterranea]
MTKTLMMMTAAGLAMASAGAAAQDYYVAGKLGFLLSADSSNSGDVGENFVLGLDAGTLTSDANYVFDSEFEVGGFASIALGKATALGPFRSELELSYTRANVKDHDDFRALGGSLQAVDAGVLVGATEPLGINIGRVIEDAQGSVSTIGFMVNGYYDFTVPSEDVHPFIGLGIGVVNTNVDYDPSGLGLVDDNSTGFGWQAMIGVDYDLSATTALHAGFRYRAAESVEVETGGALGLVSDLEIDVDQFIAEVGYRWSF